MNIVMLISSFYPIVAGAETQAQRLGASLVKKGHSVTVITRWHEGMKSEEMIEGIRVKRINVSKNPKLAPILYMIKSILYIMKNKKKIDVIHAHALSAPGVTASLASFITGIKSIVKITGGGNHLGSEIKRIYHQKSFGKLRVSFFRKYISKFIAISNAIEQDLIDLKVPKSKIEFLPNGINMDEYQMSEASKLSFLSELGLRDDHKIFLYCGRFEKIKGIDILLEAWTGLEDKLKENSKLILLGEGSENISKSLSDKTIIHRGKVENVKDYLGIADYFILPSRYEGISNALLEAMSSKLVILASDAGGNVDLIQHGVNGYLFPKEDIEALKVIIKEQLITKENDAIMSENAYNFIKDNYNLKEITNSYIELYHHLAK